MASEANEPRGESGKRSDDRRGVPRGTPQAIVATLFDAFTQAMKDPGVAKRLATADAMVVLSKSPEAFRKFWEDESNRWAKVVNDIGAVAQR